ncbi:MAG: hypothetical protein WA700_09510 [Acidobacteriaceae bacterium]
MDAPTLVKPMTNGSKRPIVRSRILSARFTDSEFAALESLAWSKGTTVSDWARDALLHHLSDQGEAAMEMHIFIELVGIQMLLMNALEPLLRGEKMAQDQLAVLFRRVQTTKVAQAQELLAKRSQNKEK